MTLLGGIEYEGLVPYSYRGAHGIHAPESRSTSGKAIMSKKLKVGLLDESSVRLDCCELASIPHEVFSKARLRELVLSKNCIGILPPAIRSLRSLTVLRLDRNQLSVLPPELGELAGLRQLDLSHNQISEVPMELGLCLELTWVNLIDNPLNGLAPGDEERTFLQVYFGQLEPPWKSDLTQQDVTVKRGTNRLLALLRDSLDPAAHGDVAHRVAAIRQAEVLKKLKQVVECADAEGLERALRTAEKIGIEPCALTRRAHEALDACYAMNEAKEGRDVPAIRAAIKRWQGCVQPGSFSGADLEAAQAAIKRLQREEQERGWQQSLPSSVSTYSVALAAEEAAKQVAVREEERRNHLLSVGALSYEEWAEQKERATKRERERFRRFQEETRLADERRARAKEEDWRRLKELESKWPSRMPKEHRPGSFTNRDRLEEARRMYTRGFGSANVRGSRSSGTSKPSPGAAAAGPRPNTSAGPLRASYPDSSPRSQPPVAYLAPGATIPSRPSPTQRPPLNSRSPGHSPGHPSSTGRPPRAQPPTWVSPAVPKALVPSSHASSSSRPGPIRATRSCSPASGARPPIQSEARLPSIRSTASQGGAASLQGGPEACKKLPVHASTASGSLNCSHKQKPEPQYCKAADRHGDTASASVSASTSSASKASAAAAAAAAAAAPAAPAAETAASAANQVKAEEEEGASACRQQVEEMERGQVVPNPLKDIDEYDDGIYDDDDHDADEEDEGDGDKTNNLEQFCKSMASMKSSEEVKQKASAAATASDEATEELSDVAKASEKASDAARATEGVKEEAMEAAKASDIVEGKAVKEEAMEAAKASGEAAVKETALEEAKMTEEEPNAGPTTPMPDVRPHGRRGRSDPSVSPSTGTPSTQTCSPGTSVTPDEVGLPPIEQAEERGDEDVDNEEEEEEEVPMFFIDAGKNLTDVGRKLDGEPAATIPLWAADLPTPGAVMADAELLLMPEVSIVGGYNEGVAGAAGSDRAGRGRGSGGSELCNEGMARADSGDGNGGKGTAGTGDGKQGQGIAGDCDGDEGKGIAGKVGSNAKVEVFATSGEDNPDMSFAMDQDPGEISMAGLAL